MQGQARRIGRVHGAGQYRYSRQGEIIRCPWHGWEYDLRTGKSWCEPHRARVRNFPVAIEPGRTLVEGPYVAETFPIRIEDDYVVIDTQPPATTASADRTA